jgi:hypothetical protein
MVDNGKEFVYNKNDSVVKNLKSATEAQRHGEKQTCN